MAFNEQYNAKICMRENIRSLVNLYITRFWHDPIAILVTKCWKQSRAFNDDLIIYNGDKAAHLLIHVFPTYFPDGRVFFFFA